MTSHSPELAQVISKFQVRISPEMQAIMQGPDDPIYRQFMPTEAEALILPEELDDPIGDKAHEKVKGIIHRYPDRVLLKPTHICPVYCRFCFRKTMVGPEGEVLKEDELERALDYIRTHEAIWEVILTGGDPFMLSPRRIDYILRTLEAIPHVKSIRFHTRVPIVEPSRVTLELLKVLESEKAIWISVHSNHVHEITDASVQAIRSLRRTGASLVSQTVLLKGINDDPEILMTLFRRLVELGVKPYYLHQGDLAPGTSHFRVPLARGQEIMDVLQRNLSGIARPIYTLDVPGGSGKIPVNKGYIDSDGTVF